MPAQGRAVWSSPLRRPGYPSPNPASPERALQAVRPFGAIRELIIPRLDGWHLVTYGWHLATSGYQFDDINPFVEWNRMRGRVQAEPCFCRTCHRKSLPSGQSLHTQRLGDGRASRENASEAASMETADR